MAGDGMYSAEMVRAALSHALGTEALSAIDDLEQAVSEGIADADGAISEAFEDLGGGRARTTSVAVAPFLVQRLFLGLLDGADRAGLLQDSPAVERDAAGRIVSCESVSFEDWRAAIAYVAVCAHLGDMRIGALLDGSGLEGFMEDMEASGMDAASAVSAAIGLGELRRSIS